MYSHLIAGAASGLGRQISSDPKTPGGPSTIAEEAVDQLQENEKLVAGKERWQYTKPNLQCHLPA
jgi:hypothetical protein